ncbi:MAG: GntR family transcriptional regulator [Lachnospiraceae bacterium]|nr:GntR family transcriptional regulator [Ruminococcus sp.]MCM1275348.1 GntR family transcriptional regulator [Lachnospiraceae bacterium]
MNIIITNSGGVPIYEQIATQIKGLILGGALREGDALPSMRALAQDLRVSVITTKRAYEILESEGFIQSFTGRGSFVSAADPEMLRENNLREIEEHLGKAADIAKQSGVTKEELMEILAMFYGE